MPETLSPYVTTKEISRWLDVNNKTILKWPWFREHMVHSPGSTGCVPLWVVEELVGGPLEPMYTRQEVLNYLGVGRTALENMRPRRVQFGDHTIRYPESSVMELKARRSARKFRSLTD